MGYNWAKEKMKKCIRMLVLTVVMVMGMQILPISAASENDKGDEPLRSLMKAEGCISGYFRAQEDDWSGTFALNSDCTFSYTEREGRTIYDPIHGTYSIDGDIYPGAQTTIRWYVNGQSYGTATLAWPVQEGLMIINNGDVYRKM